MSDIKEGNGFGYINKKGKKCMIRCFSCGSENYSMVVSTGYCAICGFDANNDYPGDKDNE